MAKLKISPDLALPPDAVTSTIVVYGGKGMGKTNLASVLVEEFAAAHLRFAVIDPMGVWWGLRHGASGKGDGIKVLILGGIHGDLPIEPASGAIVADLVVDEDVSVIIDISRRADGSMWSIAERVRFVTAYAKRLYQRQGEKRRPIAQVIDEAARFAPQIVRQGESEVAACMGAVAVLVEEGRNVGIGVTLVTQRSARLNKDVAELADCMIAFRIVGPNSMRAVLDWLGEHVEKSRLKEIGEKLRSLPRGSALVVSPGWLEFEGIVAMRKRKTFDSSKTPEAGKQVRASGEGAKPDLDKYRVRMAAVVERAQADDPKQLRAKIAELVKERDQLSRAVNLKSSSKVEVKTVEKSIIKDTQIKRIEKTIESGEKLALRLVSIADKTSSFYKKAVELVAAGSMKLESELAQLRTAIRAPQTHHEKLVALPKASKPVALTKKTEQSANGHAVPMLEGLQPAHLRFLTAIAWWESIGVPAPDLGSVAFVAGTTATSGAFNNNRSRLRTGGYITYPSSNHVSLTAEGRAIAPPPVLPPTNEALHGAVFEQLTPALSRMLRTLIEVYPNEISLEELAERAGTNAGSGAFNNNRSWLRARGLADYPSKGFVKATELLFPEGAS